MEQLGSWATSIIQAIAGQVSAGVQLVVGWIIDLGILLMSWLPDHAPIAWPDPGAWALLFRPLGVASRFIDTPILFVSLTVMLGWTTAILLYSAYRSLLGFFPALK